MHTDRIATMRSIRKFDGACSKPVRRDHAGNTKKYHSQGGSAAIAAFQT